MHVKDICWKSEISRVDIHQLALMTSMSNAHWRVTVLDEMFCRFNRSHRTDCELRRLSPVQFLKCCKTCPRERQSGRAVARSPSDDSDHHWDAVTRKALKRPSRVDCPLPTTPDGPDLVLEQLRVDLQRNSGERADEAANSAGQTEFSWGNLTYPQFGVSTMVSSVVPACQPNVRSAVWHRLPSRR